MKNFAPLIGLVMMTLDLTACAQGQTDAASTVSKEATYDQAPLSAVGRLADVHLSQTRQTLDVVGGIGASIFVDDLSQMLNERLKLPAGSLFYALTTDGLTAFHIDPKLDFVDPRQLQNPSLSEAVVRILSREAGEVPYEFNGSPRHVYFNTSALTGWRVVFGRVLPRAQE